MKAKENNLAIRDADRYLDSVKDIERFSDAPELSTSPFIPAMLDSFEIRRKTVYSEKVMTSVDIVNHKTGEVISGITENRVFLNKQLVDKEKFVKVYYDGVSSMFNLSKTAMRVFQYIIGIMTEPRNIDNDCIYIGVQDVMDRCDYKFANMVYVGLTELISAGIIAKANKPPNHYWIDPKTAFNGNRVIVMNEYIRKRETSSGELDE